MKQVIFYVLLSFFFANIYAQNSSNVINPNIPCVSCDKVQIIISPTEDVIINPNNTFTFNQPISVISSPPKRIKSVKTELVYFEFTPESEDCLSCNKDSRTYGNLDNGTLASVSATGGGTHSLFWSFSPSIYLSSPVSASITITIPPTVKCCDATIRWCIRYVITFDDCTVCTLLVCYEKLDNSCTKAIPSSKTRINQP